jgi:hypothetical protein
MTTLFIFRILFLFLAIFFVGKTVLAAWYKQEIDSAFQIVTAIIATIFIVLQWYLPIP